MEVVRTNLASIAMVAGHSFPLIYLEVFLNELYVPFCNHVPFCAAFSHNFYKSKSMLRIFEVKMGLFSLVHKTA